MPPAMEPSINRLDRWATLGAVGVLAAFALYVLINRFGDLPAPFGASLFWDARVFAEGGKAVAAGRDPYPGFVWLSPFDLPFISAPAVAHALGFAYQILGPGLFWLLVASHAAAIVVTPLILTRLFLGKDWIDAALGYALFVCGLGAWGVTTILAGNFGATLYLLIFLGLARGLKDGNWLWFHIAVAVACQVKPPYALFWAIPVLVNGWSWPRLKQSVIAAAAAAAPFLLSYLFDPAFFQAWLDGLNRQVQVGDAGFSVYGAVFSLVWPDVTSVTPIIVHALACAAVGLFLLFDKTTGLPKAAALIVFAIFANPRMKEYDMAFAAIPLAALYLDALAPAGSDARRKALAIGALVALTAVTLKADHAPLIGGFVYAAVMAGAIFTLALKPRSA